MSRYSRLIGIDVGTKWVGLARTDLLRMVANPIGTYPPPEAIEKLKKLVETEDVEKLASQVPLGLGTPRDVGLSVAFLCGEGGRYINGTTIDVNGGWYLR